MPLNRSKLLHSRWKSRYVQVSLVFGVALCQNYTVAEARVSQCSQHFVLGPLTSRLTICATNDKLPHLLHLSAPFFCSAIAYICGCNKFGDTFKSFQHKCQHTLGDTTNEKVFHINLSRIHIHLLLLIALCLCFRSFSSERSSLRRNIYFIPHKHKRTYCMNWSWPLSPKMVCWTEVSLFGVKRVWPNSLLNWRVQWESLLRTRSSISHLGFFGPISFILIYQCHWRLFFSFRLTFAG